MLVNKRYFKSIFSALMGAALLVTAVSATAQDGISTVYQLKDGTLNKTSIYLNFTQTLQLSSRIKAVLDFDAAVLKVEPVQGHANQVTVFALDTGVTTVTMIDEFDQTTKVEILVKGDVRHLETTLERLFPDDDIKVMEIKGSVLLSGWVTRPESINQIVEVAQQFFPTVMNQMRIGGNQQVTLKAEIMEVNRTKLRQLGMNFGLTRSNSFLLGTPGPITPISALAVTGTGATPSFSGFQNASVTFGFMNPSSIFQGFVDALRTEGLLKIHAQPMVTTHNGSPAELLNGGEAPVIVPAGLGTTAIEFKPFGVILNAVPHLLGSNRIRLQIEPSVVERDFANSVTVDGITVPSFTTRKVSTEVEMNMGQTLVIGGLVSRRSTGSASKIPFFGELPWIGAAFGRKEASESEIELVILVTPTYASALSAEQVPPGGPGLFTDSPTDTELMGLGLLEVPKLGDACDSSVWNCNECNSNGFCQRHPNGRWSLGAGSGSGSCGANGGSGAFGGIGCGEAGCTSCAPGFAQPMSIMPSGVAQPGHSAGQSTPSVKQIPSINTNAQLPVSHSRQIVQPQNVQQTNVQPARPQARTSSTTSNPVRSGLLSPLLR